MKASVIGGLSTCPLPLSEAVRGDSASRVSGVSDIQSRLLDLARLGLALTRAGNDDGVQSTNSCAISSFMISFVPA